MNNNDNDNDESNDESNVKSKRKIRGNYFIVTGKNAKVTEFKSVYDIKDHFEKNGEDASEAIIIRGKRYRLRKSERWIIDSVDKTTDK